MSGKHTLTPWRLGKNGDDCAKNHAICADGLVIAKVYGKGFPISEGWSPESQADAAHIVKCVNCHDELLTALEALTFSINLTENGKGVDLDAWDFVLNQASVAILKARAA